MRKHSILPTLIAGVFAGLFLFACAEKKADTTQSLIRVGVVPDESRELLEKKYAPLFEYLRGETGLTFKLSIPESYAQMLEMFGAGKVDLVYFGGATFVKAVETHKAAPLVMRDVDTRFTSYFVVKKDSVYKSIEELKGKKLAFGSKLSTSGHMMPHYFLSLRKIAPEDFFSETLYSGSHDKTAYMVRDGKADVGAVNSAIVDAMLKDGRLGENDIRIMWETPPYPDYVWTLRADISKEVKIKLRNAFLGLSEQDGHGQILASLGAGIFLPASGRDFANLKSIMSGMGMLGK